MLDTNFLLIPAALGVDIFSEIDRLFPEYQLYILDTSLEELDYVAEKGGLREKQQVKLAKAIIKTQNIKIVDCDTHVDDKLVELSEEEYIISTQDKELKKRIGKPIIALMQKKYLIFD